MEEIWIAVIGTLGGALIGSIIAPYFTHRYSLKKLDTHHKRKIEYLKEETFFKRKLNYFERITEAIEDNILFCDFAINHIKNCEKEEDWRKVKAMLENSKILQMQGSPLYSDNLKKTAIGIVKYLRAWEELIKVTRKMPKTKNERKNLIEHIKKIREKMMSSGKETVEQMRKELIK